MKATKEQALNKVDSMSALCSEGKEQVKELLELLYTGEERPIVKVGQVWRTEDTYKIIIYDKSNDIYTFIGSRNSSGLTYPQFKSLSELSAYFFSLYDSAQLYANTIQEAIR